MVLRVLNQLVCAFLLVGCSGGPTDSQPPDAAPPRAMLRPLPLARAVDVRAVAADTAVARPLPDATAVDVPSDESGARTSRTSAVTRAVLTR